MTSPLTDPITGTGWWEDLTATALVGTGRRPPPDLPPWPTAERLDAGREVTVLDAAALGGMLRRAGRRPTLAPDLPEAAGQETRPVAAPRAHQLLDLLLTQSPVGAALTPSLTAEWLATARRLGRRVHHVRVPDVLTLATAHPDLREDAREVAGQRGLWLARFERPWAWVLNQPAEAPAGDWVRLPAGPRLSALRDLRRTDPGPARELVESVWPSTSAAERAQLVTGLAVGLGEADEDFLERCLDDRARGVREAAWPLLDRRPGSRRAQRMGERLRGLLTRRGGLHRGELELELPQTPDAAAVRDGLVPGPRGRSERGFWLERIASAAPLSVWTDVSRWKPEQVVATTSDLDALVGIRAATLARSDQEWARALLTRSWDPALLALVPAAEREAYAVDRLARVKDPADVGRVLAGVPTPWGPEWSRAVVGRLAADQSLTDTVLARHGTPLVVALATGLHPVTFPDVQRWTHDRGPADRVLQIAQYVTLHARLEEAFE